MAPSFKAGFPELEDSVRFQPKPRDRAQKKRDIKTPNSFYFKNSERQRQPYQSISAVDR